MRLSAGRAVGFSLLIAPLVACCALASARAAEAPIPPAPKTWVTDTAGVLSPATREQLESRLAAYNRATGHQVIVWISNTTGDTPLEDWTIRAFTAWKVGRKGLNDGLALFIFMQDKKVRIEVGYGLEPIVTDAIASRIARNEIAARMRQGDVDGAVTGGVAALLAAIGGEKGAPATQNPAANNGDAAVLLGVGLAVFFILLAFSLAVRGRRWIHMYPIGSSVGSYGPFSSGGFFSGWSSGSGGGGFGGFSGGGGMAGGGGASASW